MHRPTAARPNRRPDPTCDFSAAPTQTVATPERDAKDPPLPDSGKLRAESPPSRRVRKHHADENLDEALA